MNRIKQMPKSLSEKIAAGEVVTNPLSVVKELVENSIDAEATKLVIEIKDGGKSYIRVTDDGLGIANSDMDLAFKPHATSKITTQDDLERINTLGFRGEALTSIAAVSKIELISKTKDEKAGSLIRIEGGEVLKSTDIGTSDGTSALVKDLFYNTPARLKFMKSDRAESASIIDFVSKVALAYPEIKVRLINNGNVLFSTNGKGDIVSNILTIYGKELAKDLLKVEHVSDDSEISLFAYISAPTNSRSSKRNQIFFVNGRVVTSKLLDKAVMSAYRELLFDKRYPIVYLFLSIEPSALDVNIHPAKTEIRFKEENKIEDFISNTFRKVLLSREATPNVELTTNQTGDKIEEKTKISEPIERKFHDFKIEKIIDNPKETFKSEQVNIKNILSTKIKESESQEYEITETAKKETRDIEIENLRILGSAFATYIIAQDDDTLYFIDQHAAHERIYYEKLIKQYKMDEKPSQSLLSPYIIESPYAASTYPWKAVLTDFGYEVEEFGNNSYLVKAVPAFMSFIEAEEFLNYIVDNIGEDELKDQTKIDKIIMNACKSAIKGNERLHESEIGELLKELQKCDNPYSCPHGRPTFIKLQKNDMEKLFKRI